MEAQRIIKIIDELLLNMEVLCYLDYDFITNFMEPDGLDIFDPKLVQGLQPQILKLLKYQGKLEAKFTELSAGEESKAFKLVQNEDTGNKDSDNEGYYPEETQEELARIEAEKKAREEKREKDANIISKQLSQNLKIIIRYFRNNEEEFKIIKVL